MSSARGYSLGGVFPFHDRTPVKTQIEEGEFVFPDEYFGSVSDDGAWPARIRRRTPPHTALTLSVCACGLDPAKRHSDRPGLPPARRGPCQPAQRGRGAHSPLVPEGVAGPVRSVLNGRVRAEATSHGQLRSDNVLFLPDGANADASLFIKLM